MGGLLSKLGAGLAYFSIASLLALGILVGIGWFTGRLTAEKVARLRSVILGIEETQAIAAPPGLEAEMPSYDEILEQRAIDFRQLELREEVVRQNVSLMNREQAAITSKRQEFESARKMFDEQLAALEEQLNSTGEENVRLTFENIKPAQAKQQIEFMLQRGEMEKVVSLLAAMSITKRAKIIAEFKTPEEASQVSKILELMGDGAPLAPLVEESRNPTTTPPVQR